MTNKGVVRSWSSHGVCTAELGMDFLIRQSGYPSVLKFEYRSWLKENMEGYWFFSPIQHEPVGLLIFQSPKDFAYFMLRWS